MRQHDVSNPAAMSLIPSTVAILFNDNTALSRTDNY